MVCKTLSPVYLIVYEVDDYDDNITLQTSGFFFNEDFLELAEKFTFTTKLPTISTISVLSKIF